MLSLRCLSLQQLSLDCWLRWVYVCGWVHLQPPQKSVASKTNVKKSCTNTLYTTEAKSTRALLLVLNFVVIWGTKQNFYLHKKILLSPPSPPHNTHCTPVVMLRPVPMGLYCGAWACILQRQDISLRRSVPSYCVQYGSTWGVTLAQLIWPSRQLTAIKSVATELPWRMTKYNSLWLAQDPPPVFASLQRTQLSMIFRLQREVCIRGRELRGLSGCLGFFEVFYQLRIRIWICSVRNTCKRHHCYQHLATSLATSALQLALKACKLCDAWPALGWYAL